MTCRWISPTTLFLILSLGAAGPASAQEGGERGRRPERERPERHVERERPERGPERSEEHRSHEGRREEGVERALPRGFERGEPRSERPQARQESPRQARPEPLREPLRREQPAPRARGEIHPARSSEEAKAWQSRKGWREGAWSERPTWREHRARHWEAEHRTWSQRGGYGGYVIPERDYRLRFGDRNVFRIQSRPVIYEGYPRFQCGGYWFLIVDPWPEFWVDDWYVADELWIDYDGGYYLHSRRYPGVSLAITVSL